jgi:MOSC domain-containing protein YiiM
MRTGVTAAMRVRLSDAHLLEDLKSYLEAAECRVRRVDRATLEVTIDRAPSAEQAEREAALYLKTWQAMNPGFYARVVDGGTIPPA